MNKQLSFPQRIVKAIFFLGVYFLKKVFPLDPNASKLLAEAKPGTTGYVVKKSLERNQLELVPKFESHDLKHAVLDLEMTPLDETRLQAFMLGNGNWTIFSMAIFTLGFLSMPHRYRLFMADYQRGNRSEKIFHWTLDEYCHQDIDDLRQKIAPIHPVDQPISVSLFLRISIVMTVGMIVGGAFMMVYCLPYLYSSNIADLVGAGFPFVAGSVMIVGGMINFAIISGRFQKQLV